MNFLPGRFAKLRNKMRKIKPLRLVGAMLLALGILVADYYVGNMSFPIFDSSLGLALQAYLHDYRMDDDLYDKLLTVNTARDKALAAEYDEFGRETGTVAVSDRERLSDFLDIVKDADYKYIFIDLRFESNVVTPQDSALYSLIATMPRLVYSHHREQEANPVIGEDKSAYADFRNIIGEGFSRYEFVQDGKESIALRLFHDMTGRTIVPAGMGTYRDTDGSLCYNMQFVPFPLTATRDYASDGRVLHPLLGFHILSLNTPDQIREMVKDKLIVIGDFENDRHDTYVGSVPGPLLSLYAWNLLNHNGHKVNYLLQLFLFVFFTIILYVIMLPDDRKHIKNPWLSFVLTLLGWGAALWMLKSMLYWLFGLSFLVVIPAAVFAIINFIKDLGSRLSHKRP